MLVRCVSIRHGEVIDCLTKSLSEVVGLDRLEAALHRSPRLGLLDEHQPEARENISYEFGLIARGREQD